MAKISFYKREVIVNITCTIDKKECNFGEREHPLPECYRPNCSKCPKGIKKIEEWEKECDKEE